MALVQIPTADSGVNGTYLTKYSTNTNYIRSGNTTSTNQSATVNTTVYTPLLVSAITADRISCYTASTFTLSGSVVVRLGIYNNNTTTNTPSTVLLDAGTVSPTAASTAYEITINQALTPGLYWLAFNMQTAGTGNNNFVANNNTLSWSPNGLTYTSAANLFAGTSQINGYTESSITGAFATAGTLVRNTSGQIIAGLRY